VSSSPTTPLVTVYHFSKEPSHAHSVPFKLHVQPTDSIQNIKILIKNRLGLPDKDMEKIKLAIVTANNHASYPEDDSCTIGEYWEAGAYIGLDHPDRSATKKQGFWQEKAIKIHN
jgi:ubiquitin carboxyl-terminal hydrolase 7